MSFTRVNPPNWAVGDPLTSAQMNALDIDHANALDKTAAGDTLSGIVNIASGGQINATSNNQLISSHVGGIQAAVAGGIKCGVINGIQTDLLGGLQSTIAGGIQTTAVGGIQLAGGVGDFPTFNPTRTKAYRFGMRPVDPSAVVPVGTGGAKWTYGSFPGILTGNATTTTINLWLENPHHNATLFALTMYYAVGQGHTNVPANMPTLGVYRLPAVLGSSPNNVVALNSGGNLAIPTPGSGAAWFSSGNIQTFSYPTNQNAVIDNTSFVYLINIQDENGANSLSGNMFIHFLATYLSIADMTFPV